MSIINQALQKAQREQLRHSQQEMPYRLPGQRTRAPRRRWLLAPLGLVAAVGVGATLHAWFLTPTGREPVPPELVTTSSPLVIPIPPATPLPATPVVQADTESPLPEPQVNPLPSDSELPPLAPVVASADPPPMPTDSAPPPTAPVPPPPSAAMPLPRVVPPVAPAPVEVARAQALVQRAAAAQETKELTRALTLLEQAIKLDPTAKAAYNSLGNVYYQQRRYQQALTMYQKALAIDPDYVKARTNLGSTYMQLAMDTRAIDELQKALQADSSYSLAYYNLACVYARSGNSIMAAQYLQQAIVLEPQARTWAQTDVDFARMRTAPEVQQLLGP
jgi:TPR repeat/Tetratricopeptide repeat